MKDFASTQNGRLLVSRSGLTASRNVGTKTGEIQVAAGGNNAAITLIIMKILLLVHI